MANLNSFESAAHVKHKVHGSDPCCGLTFAGAVNIISSKAGGHHMQMLPRENSALDLHGNTMLVAQHKGCRGTSYHIHHWKEQSGGKDIWKSSTP